MLGGFDSHPLPLCHIVPRPACRKRIPSGGDFDHEVREETGDGCRHEMGRSQGFASATMPLCLSDSFAVVFDVRGRIAGVDYQRTVSDDRVIVECGMISCDQNRIQRREVLWC